MAFADEIRVEIENYLKLYDTYKNTDFSEQLKILDKALGLEEERYKSDVLPLHTQIKTIEKVDTTPWFYMTLREQLKEKKYPEIKQDFPNLSKYDMIFVGAPVWWYTMATPLYSFLQKVDFGGKKVVPFSTQGSNFGTYFEDFAKQAKNANLQISQDFNNLPNDYQKEERNKVVQWLNQL